VRDIPLTINTPEGWAVQEASAKTVSVTFRGSQNDIRALEKSQIRVEINVREGTSKSMIIDLNRKNVNAPRSVRALYVEPGAVDLTLDRETEKEVNVEIAQLGDPPDGYIIEDSGVSPGRVKIFGPERRLAEIETVRTEPIDMAGRIRSFSNSIPLAAPSGLLMAKMDVQRVMVSFAISEVTHRRDIKNIPVRILLPPGVSPDVRINPKTVDVSLKGRINIITNLSERSVQAFVDYEDMGDADTAELPVEVTTLVPGINVMIVDPPNVRVERNSTRKK
jgi:YbbR domain-containing protein